MSTTVITDFTTRPVLRPDLTEMVAWMQEAYRDRQANADKAGDVEEATMYQAEAYAYHDILTHLTARQCEACGVHEGDDTVRADVLATCRGTKSGTHVWDFPDAEPEGDLGPRYVADAPFPQSPEEARTCEHGNQVWFGHECGLCDGQGQYRWHDDRECRMVPIGVEAEVGEWHQCVVHNYQVLGDAYVCEGYTPPPYVEVDHRPCVEAGEHVVTQRHPRTECPADDAGLEDEEN